MGISLIIAPHADDETLGCGATIAKMTGMGDKVFVAFMTNACVGAPELYPQHSIEKVRAEARKAQDILGVKEEFYFDLPAPQLDQYPQYKISNIILDLINKIKPDTVFVPHRGDIHNDHKILYNAALVATRPQNGCPVKKVLAYETLSETEWASPFQEAVFIPNYFIEVSEEDLIRKKEAMAAYQSQLRCFPNTRSLEVIEMLARYRGSIIGVTAAEAFSVVRILE